MLFEFSGEDGKYSIETAGIHPEVGDGYRYRDAAHDFYFYAQATRDHSSGAYLVKIVYPTKRRFAGPPITFPAESKRVIEKNIKHFFSNIDLIGRPITSDSPQQIVSFGWR